MNMDNLNGAKAFFDYVNAVYTLFEKTRERQEIKQTVEEITNNGLREDYLAKLNQIVIRLERAVGITQYLEKRFGCDDGLITDYEGLYHLIYQGKHPKIVEARSENLGIGFTRKVWSKSNEMIGYASDGFLFDQLTVPLEQTIERLEKNKRTNYADLIYFIPTTKYIASKLKKGEWNEHDPNQNPANLLLNMFESKEEIIQTRTREHELRHVIDQIIGKGKYSMYIETPAEMYTFFCKRGFLRDIEREKRNIQSCIDSKKRVYETLSPIAIRDTIPEDLKREMNIEGIKQKIAELEKTINEIPNMSNTTHNLVREILNNFPSTELIKTLSYVFSLLPEEDVIGHINALNEHKDNIFQNYAIGKISKMDILYYAYTPKKKVQN